MKTRFNQNGTVSIIGMGETLYYAIQNIIRSSEQCFDEPEDSGEFYSNDAFVCSLSQEEKEALDKAGWDL